MSGSYLEIISYFGFFFSGKVCVFGPLPASYEGTQVEPRTLHSLGLHRANKWYNKSSRKWALQSLFHRSVVIANETLENPTENPYLRMARSEDLKSNEE